VSAARAFEATSHIAATPAEVWPVLTAVAAWPTWDSGVLDVEGTFGLGAKLTITVAANPGKAFPVKVTEIDEPVGMVFRGGMPLGLFVGERTYTLAAEQGGTRFTMREEYTGLMAGMIVKSIPDLNSSFQQFADGLAQRVQQLPST
jgi:uncharacterized protein YndB with AHSA1/START domain